MKDSQSRFISVISTSGGMDSTSLLLRKLREGKEVYAIGFNYGQRHAVELDRLKANLNYLKQKNILVNYRSVDLRSAFSTLSSALTDTNREMPEGFYAEENMKQTVVPNRNAIFSSIVFGHALALYEKFSCKVEISLGVHSGDHAIYPDCRPEFYNSIYQAFQVGNWNGSQISLDLPYLSEDKGTILEDALQSCAELDLDFDTIFRNTNTSYEPDEQGRSSGKTGADVERILAFHKIGRQDPVPYQKSWSEVLSYALQVEQDFLARQNK
jgi:7-cyano-7-deazaguanine synthase